MPDEIAKVRGMQARSVVYALIRCGQALNELGVARLNASSKAPPLREAHTRLVPYLLQPGGVRVSDVARVLEVSKQAVHQLVGELREAGIVSVKRDPEDARARRVHLTGKGLASVVAGTQVLLALDAVLAPKLSRAKTKQLHALLREVMAVLEVE